MSKTKGYPNQQLFNIGARKNLTKKNSWWSNPPYHNNKILKSGDKA